jgi:ligand-binding sensor domain-containing protein/serine phosphatase RsbU (regulator of sigma subunit)
LHLFLLQYEQLNKPMKRVVLIILLISNLSYATESMAQSPMTRSHSLLKEDYTVNVIYQDPDGLIWFGTNRGLFRSDGIAYKWFTTANGLCDNNVTSLCSARNGILWIGHKNGMITQIKGNSVIPFKPEEGLGSVAVTDIVSDSAGVIWYSTDGDGIFRWDYKHLSNMDTKDGLSGDEVYDMEIDFKGVIWLATYSGITRYSEGKCEIISMKDGLPDNYVKVLKSGPDGRLWIGTDEKGISVYDPEKRSFTSTKNWNSGSVTGLAITMDKDIWVSTEDNVIQMRISGKSDWWQRSIKVSQSEKPVHIRTIIRDIEENIWVGGQKFITQILPPVFEFMNKSNGSPFDMCSSLIEDSSGDLWVCTEKGLYRGRRELGESLNWVNLNEKMRLGNTNFISLWLDNKGMVWAGTYGSGAYRIDPSSLKYTKYTTSDGLSNNNIVSISGKDNMVWFSTLGGGVSSFNSDNGKIKSYIYSELKESYVYSTRSDKKGKTWIAGSLRLPAYILNDSLYLMKSVGQRLPQLYGIALDILGKPWFNTRDKGIIMLKDDSIKMLGKSEGITFDKIQSIVFDKFNNLLIISDKGILFYNPDKGVILEYGENSGLSDRDPVDNAVFTDREGLIWIGTQTGIIRYNPDYLHLERNIPRIFLSEKKQDYNPIIQGKKKFRYTENNFTFTFTGIWFSNPDGLKYRYMLKGNDRGWIYSGSFEPRTYSNLPAGEFTFIAEVSLDEKNWYNSPDSAYSFKIYPPFWRTWWFISVFILLGVFAIYSYIRLRLIKLQKDKERLEMEVGKRTEEIRNQNLILAEQKKEIGMQRDLAEAQRDKIEVQKEEIQASIRYARKIQSAALPPKKHIDNILGDHFILNKPCEIISGDFYWVARSGSKTFFAAVDCTGHGVPGAFMSMLGMSALNDIVKSLSEYKASAILDHLRERIQESLHQGGDREMVTHDGMDISLCILETNTNMLQFSGARSPLYIIRKGEINVVLADKIDIGYLTLEKLEFTNQQFQCEPGDQIYLFTDGFADQFGGPDGKKFKYQRFKDFLVSIHSEPMERQAILLDKEIEDWKGKRPQIDDILIMGVKIQRRAIE